MNNIEILKKTNLGDSVAEQEQDSLQDYFIKTEAWEMLNDGRVDIVYGGKGTGKSALYLLLLRGAKNLLEKKGICLIPGEEIIGAPVFQSLTGKDISNEDQFRNLWKVYILSLIGNYVKDNATGKDELLPILNRLQKEGLIPYNGLSRIFSVAKSYVLKAKHTFATPEGSYTIVLGELSPEDEKAGKTSVNHLLQEIDNILVKNNIRIWILFDRLDVAFSDPTIETPALRSLFRVYLDFAGFKNIKLKIFLRDDIWSRITREQGFREQSHITRSYHIRWTEDSLRHLILMRFFNNPAIEEYSKLKKEMLGNEEIQKIAFDIIFPEQAESGPKKSKTFDWILRRTQDGKQSPAPREIINLIKFAREQQVRLGEIGGIGSNPEGHLVSANALNLALEEVSKVKVETVWAEYPDLRKYIELFRGKKTEHTIDTIKNLFELQGLNDTVNIVQRLIDVGFFQEKRGTRISYWVPFIFRPYLSMSQGAASGEGF